MELTGKAKIEFEKWYDNHHEFETGLPVTINGFYKLENSLQYGVYIDFFDSVGICSSTYRGYDMDNESFEYVQLTYHHDQRLDSPEITEHSSLHEARSKAIDKACEIFNSMKK